MFFFFTCKAEASRSQVQVQHEMEEEKNRGVGRERDIVRGYISVSGAAETTQGLRVNTVLTEEPSSAPRLQSPVTAAPGDLMPFSGLCRYLCSHAYHTHAHTHIKYKIYL